MKDVPLENIANGLKVSTLGAKRTRRTICAQSNTNRDIRCGTRAILGGTANVTKPSSK
jgi:hypothetical protein